MHNMDRLFLDANVLFSAAYRIESRLVDLWSLANTELIISIYAFEEANRNLAEHRPDALARLEKLADKLTIINCIDLSLPKGIDLAEKDIPILAAAISAQCTHLITGDNQHFGSFYGASIEGVLILTPSQYLKSRIE
jgi:predicted nucleic acid-binding protein